MPRLIFKCPYIKGGSVRAASHLENYVSYMATRKGVDAVDPGLAGKPATRKQQKMVEQLAREFPLSRGLVEYEHYQASPTRANASDFIARAIEDNLDQIAKKENYLRYIAQRPRAQRMGAHGLFTGDEDSLVLSQVAETVARHPGRVWLPIISLKREDASRLSYDSADQWRELLTQYAPEMAKAMKIPLDQFRWYAAFHDEGNHPHVHMVCYSADGTSGYLDKEGIAAIKAGLVKEIFRQELAELYDKQTRQRDELTRQARDTMARLIREMQTGTLDNPRIEWLVEELSKRLSTVRGKKQYGYLPPAMKSIVDEAVDELAKDPRVAAAYALWYDLREEVLRTYRNDLPPRLPLSQQKEFKHIKNAVIQKSVRLHEIELEAESAAERTESVEMDLAAQPDEEPREIPPGRGRAARSSSAWWSPEYKRARAYLYGTEEQPPDFRQALGLFRSEAERGNPLAMCDLGRMCADGLGCDPNLEESHGWYEQALSAFLDAEERKPDRYVEYRIGKLYAAGLGTEQDESTAAAWFGKAAEQNYSYAQYSLAGLYLRGQGVEQNAAEAFRLYTAAANQGFPYAAYQLGKLLLSGNGCEADAEESAAWFRAAFQGFTVLERQSHDDKLQYRIGWMLLHGAGVPKDEAAAQIWFEKAARMGNPQARYQVAKRILSGESSDADQVRQAVEWLTESANAGHDYAQYALGKLYRDGVGVEKDPVKAVIWFSAAAEQGSSYAAYALGKLYQEDGRTSSALRWFQQAAELGNPFAQYRLGKLLLSGDGTAKDVGGAIGWFTAAAEQGNQYAQYQLGKLYLLGKEVPADKGGAVYWFSKAAAQGNEYAQYFLDHINDPRGPSALQAATRLLYHMSRIFRERAVSTGGGIVWVDKKLRQRIREKKIAMGHKEDDHAEPVQGQTMQY